MPLAINALLNAVVVGGLETWTDLPVARSTRLTDFTSCAASPNGVPPLDCDTVPRFAVPMSYAAMSLFANDALADLRSVTDLIVAVLRKSVVTDGNGPDGLATSPA